jgi:hypothetical protein
MYAIFQWWNGSSWVDVGTETVSSPALVRSQDPETGVWRTQPKAQINISTSKTGLTAGSSNRFRLMGRKVSGAPSSTYTYAGTAGATG